MSQDPTTLLTLAQMQQLRFEVAIENMVEGLCFFDGAQRLILSNRRYAEMYGLPPDQVRPGVTLREIIAMRFAVGSCPRMTEQEYHDWRNKVAVAHQRSETIVEMMNGRTFSIKHQPMPDGGWVATHEDISERRRQEEELRRNQNHLSLAQRVSRTGSALHDRKTGVYEWSDELYHILGIEPGTVSPTFDTFLEVIHPDDRADVAAAHSDIVTAASGPAREYRIVRPNGQVRIVQCQAAPLSAEFGWEGCVLFAFRDVTELRAAEHRERDLERQLQHAQKLDALGTLAGGIAHDLNNTLVPVMGLAKITMRRLPVDSREHANLATILRAGERARDLIGQILAFSRKDAPTRHPVDLAALLRDSLKMLRASLPATIRIDEKIQDGAWVSADAVQLHQVVINLFVNAAQAIGHNMGTITVELGTAGADQPVGHSAVADAPFVRLSVCDTGCGIDEPTQRRIFEPFFTTKAVGEGTGLGLSLVHSIVTQHGGRITVASRIGEGTRFDIYLPALSHKDGMHKIGGVTVPA
jgi:two-component system cell cycle sensor histidine kinase/response regulator CckA